MEASTARTDAIPAADAIVGALARAGTRLMSGRPTRGTWPGAARCPSRRCPPPPASSSDDAITYQVLPDSHILVYPIPGPGGALTAGDRLVNFVWYVNVAAGGELDALMTGPRR